jgi:hypothetical protein
MIEPSDWPAIEEFVRQRVSPLEQLVRQQQGAQGCSLRVQNNGNPVAGPYNWTACAMTIERLDTGGSHAAGATWTVHRSGWFYLAVSGCWQANANGQRGVRVTDQSNAGEVLIANEVDATTGGLFTQHGHSVLRHLTEGHVLQFEAEQLNSAAIVSHAQGAGSADGSGFDAFYIGGR